MLSGQARRVLERSPRRSGHVTIPIGAFTALEEIEDELIAPGVTFGTTFKVCRDTGVAATVPIGVINALLAQG